MTTKTIYTSMLVLIAATALMGCGSRVSSSGSTDSASTAASASGKPVASCNKVSQNNFDVRLMAYTDANGVTNPSLVRLKFAQVPSEYLNDGYDIEIRKWTASSTGVVRPANSESPQYATSKLEYKSSSIFNSASAWGYNQTLNLDWYNMKLVAAANGTTTYTDPNVFFQKYNLLLDLKDPNGDWKALQIVLTYNGAAVKWVNILIPTFYANPTDYQATHPAVLSNLHPLLSMVGQGFASSQYTTETNSYCF